MKKIDFNVSQAEYVSAEAVDGDVLIKDAFGNVWMEISSHERTVRLKIFPKSIPQEYIGNDARLKEELTCNILSKAREDALECKSFLSDLIITGYGKASAQKGWLAALDLEDVTHIFSSAGTNYYALPYDSEKALGFPPEDELKNAKTLFVCTYNTKLDDAYKIVEELYKIVHPCCTVWNQFVIDETSSRKNFIHLFYSDRCA